MSNGWGPPGAGGGGGFGPPPGGPPGGGFPPAGGPPPPPAPPGGGFTPPPSQPGGFTPPPAQPGAPAPGAGPAAAPQGTWIGVIISVLMLLGSIGACLVTGLAAASASESEAVTISMATVPAAIAGLFPWIVALLTRNKGTGLAVGAPVGCGCLTWIVSLVGLVVFYAVIWPEL